MKPLLALLALAASAHAAPPESFWRALHKVETTGQHGAILGDQGRSLGPLQITRAYHADSRVPGSYEQCASLTYSRRVVEAYCRRYEPTAFARGDIDALARLHNSGPAWRTKRHLTNGYVSRIKRAMR